MIVSRFQSACDDSEFSCFCSAATKDCHLTHGINQDYRKTFLEINFLRLIHPQIILKEFNLTTCKETEEQSLEQNGRRLVTQVKTDKIKEQFQCRHLRQGRWPRVLQYRWNYRRTTWSDSKDSKYRNCNSTISLIHNHFCCGKTRLKTQVTTCSDFPSDAVLWIKEVEMVDSLDVKIITSSLWKGFSKLRDAGRKDCLCSEQDHPEFPD